jgi:hypothetical protein
MRQGNHSSAKWALAVAALVVLVSGGIVMGSNMGFKFNMALDQAGALPAPQGDNIMSFPYLVPYADRECMCQSLNLPANTAVQQFGTLTGGFSFYSCGSSTCGSAAALDTTNAVWMTSAVMPGSAIVVGAHQPTATVQVFCQPYELTNPLPPAGPLEPLPSGDNWISIPYHSTAVTNEDLCLEISPDMAVIINFNAPTGGFSTYPCGSLNANNINLTKGLSVIARMDSSSTLCTTNPINFANWVPSHF